MPEFISSDSSARHATIERFLGETESMLSDSAVQQALGARATELLTITKELLYVPNRSLNVLTKPASVRHENAVAITAINPGEHLVLTPEILTPLPVQREHLKTWLTEVNAPGQKSVESSVMNDILERVDESNQDRFIESIERNVARVMKVAAGFTLHTPKQRQPLEMNFFSRPYLTLESDQMDRRKEVGTVGVHEAEHLRQQISPLENITVRPQKDLESRDIHLRQELEAYHAQKVTQQALYLYSKQSKYFGNAEIIADILPQKVDQIRRRVSQDSDDQFAPSEALRAALAQEGINI